MRHLCDINVFVAGAISLHRGHESAKTFFEKLSPADSVEFCRSTQIGFLRLLTQPIAPGYVPVSNREAREALQEWLELPYVRVAPEPPGVERLWLQLSDRDLPSPKAWMDAWLAAFAICGRMRLVTFDQGFHRYRQEGLDLLLLREGKGKS